ncbi:ShlB/FhaC/HecB family hemolysin secretion/activation protein [Sodalis ligni]|uniref:ShlB/FhaC/HecB family hemolysin secretion/activation protein n=1 Tax=Sodalis ligni TaxID=2697027 RepID=UPI00193FF21A|nr:ShlB/FhaC/HecB family hemolysin secretion/activation protein [Sodalis ligni]QWA10025.1 ShlB/FhaC/HecB family hemolysin secretion/activation protein [Sodalis ligni]
MKHRLPVNIGFVLVGLLCVCGRAVAISPADRDVIQQQQTEQLNQDRRQLQALQWAIPLTAPPARRAAPGGPCFHLNTILLLGADTMPEPVRQRLTSPYLRQCAGLSQINLLVKQVSDWYIAQGYITSRAFLTGQDLSGGTLRLTVMEGRLQDIRLENHDARLLHMAFPGLKGKILNLRDIEQGMEQINRLRRDPVQIDIQPGSRPGYSVVNLTAAREQSLRLNVGFDNSGQKSTGVGQLNTALTLNNPLGLADQWFLNASRSSGFVSDRNARSVQAGFSLPYGYWLLDYSYSYSDYLNTLYQQGYDWRSAGDSQAHRLSLSRVVFRNGNMKTGLMLALTHRISRNNLNDTRLDSSSYELTSLTAGVNHSQKLWGGYATLSPFVSRGMPWLGAGNDYQADGQPAIDFTKWGATASYYLPLAGNFTYLTSLSGQWTADRLYGAERMTLGGESSVRGFKEQYLSGDNGGYWRNEIDRPLRVLPVLGDIGALAALDAGYLRHDRQDINSAGTLWGAAVGLSSSNRYFVSQFTVGWPLGYPRSLAPDRVSVYYRLGVVL